MKEPELLNGSVFERRTVFKDPYGLFHSCTICKGQQLDGGYIYYRVIIECEHHTVANIQIHCETKRTEQSAYAIVCAHEEEFVSAHRHLAWTTSDTDGGLSGSLGGGDDSKG